MNGKRAKILREEVAVLQGNRHSVADRKWHRPKPVLDHKGFLVSQIDRFTDTWTGYRRVYQDLKRSEGLRRSGIGDLSDLSDREVEKAQAVLDRESELRDRSNKRAMTKRRKRKAELKALEDFKASVVATGEKLIKELQEKEFDTENKEES